MGRRISPALSSLLSPMASKLNPKPALDQPNRNHKLVSRSPNSLRRSPLRTTKSREPPSIVPRTFKQRRPISVGTRAMFNDSSLITGFLEVAAMTFTDLASLRRGQGRVVHGPRVSPRVRERRPLSAQLAYKREPPQANMGYTRTDKRN